ncbi:MAG: class I SAM-dependent methyltransferase [Patescibacteria group bacterium]
MSIQNTLHILFEKIKINKDKSFWNNITLNDWADTKYPWRPKTDTLFFWDKIIKNHSNIKTTKNALVGATPEIRNIFSKYKLCLDIVDYSESMYKKMSHFCKQVDNETFIKSDWLKYFSKKKNYYDLIVGDLIERLLPDYYFSAFIKTLNKSLKTNGKLILRIHSFNKKLPKTDIKKIINIYCKKGLNANNHQTTVGLLFFILAPYYRTNKNEVNVVKIIEDIKNHNQKQKNKNIILKKFITKWKNATLHFYAKDIESIYQTLHNEGFKLEKTYNNDIGFNQSLRLTLWSKK